MSILEAKVLKKYESKSVSELKQIAQKYFNRFIRERDKDLPCISCGSARAEQAGHFYSAGHYQALRFNEDNCFGQCRRCNYYLSGNLNNYRVNLERKIGKERLNKLDLSANRKAHKWDRFELISIIEEYKNKKPS